jgi:DNA polymerase V
MIILPIINAGLTGFESPAAEYAELALSLDELLIGDKKSSSFLGLASGHSMQGVGIFSGDVLIADRSLTPKNMDVVIAVLNGELTAKIWNSKRRELVSANPQHLPVKINEEDSFLIEAVVTRSIRLFRPATQLISCLG